MSEDKTVAELLIRVDALERLLEILMQHLHWASVTDGKGLGDRWNAVISETQTAVERLKGEGI